MASNERCKLKMFVGLRFTAYRSRFHGSEVEFVVFLGGGALGI